MEEKWCPICGYEGIYEVSNLGRVRSLARTVIRSDGQKTTVREKILSGNKNTDGYLQCKLCKDGKYITVRVHRLVATAFVPNPYNLPEVNHIDTDRTNNCASNLEWASHIDNVRHSALKGHYKHFGSENQNYGGKTLKLFYKEHPEEAIKLGRPGAQNGRARPVRLLMDGNVYDFDYIGACAKFLIASGKSRTTKVQAVAAYIARSMKNKKPYLGCSFLPLEKSK